MDKKAGTGKEVIIYVEKIVGLHNTPNWIY